MFCFELPQGCVPVLEANRLVEDSTVHLACSLSPEGILFLMNICRVEYPNQFLSFFDRIHLPLLLLLLLPTNQYHRLQNRVHRHYHHHHHHHRVRHRVHLPHANHDDFLSPELVAVDVRSFHCWIVLVVEICEILHLLHLPHTPVAGEEQVWTAVDSYSFFFGKLLLHRMLILFVFCADPIF